MSLILSSSCGDRHHTLSHRHPHRANGEAGGGGGESPHNPPQRGGWAPVYSGVPINRSPKRWGGGGRVRGASRLRRCSRARWRASSSGGGGGGAILSGRPAYGYEITAWLRDQGFSDIAEGTVYALLVRIEQRGLVDVEKVPSEKGPPRKVYSLNAQGREYLNEFWRTWSFLAERLEQLREGEK